MKDDEKLFVIIAIIVCFIVIMGALVYYRTPSRYQSSSQKRRIEYIVEVTTSSGHFGVVLVNDENGEEVSYTDFRSDDEATVTNEYKINAGVGDTVIVEVQFGGYVTVRLVKEGLIFNETIAHKTDFDGIIFRYTIKEDDM